ncbi:hypothetical protein LXL04_021682 [Taraxacum kok-saghyz]
MEAVWDFDTIGVVIDDDLKKKQTSRCNDGFLNTLCPVQGSDDEGNDNVVEEEYDFDSNEEEVVENEDHFDLNEEGSRSSEATSEEVDLNENEINTSKIMRLNLSTSPTI